MIALPKKAVRPYESLLFLTWRFLSLNRPELSAFSASVNLSLYDSLHLDLICGRAGARSIELTSLRRLLGLTKLQLRQGTLDWSTLRKQVLFDFRYCLQCLEYGYHAAIFQLSTIKTCPEHHSELATGCPNCGRCTSTIMTRDFSADAFTCRRCGKVMVDLGVLIDPPAISFGAEVRIIANWYRWASDLPRSESHLLADSKDERQDVHSGEWAALELVGGRRAPDSVGLDRKALVGGSVRYVRCGIRTTSESRRSIGGQSHSRAEREMRGFFLYGLYTRHIEKQIPQTRKLIRVLLQDRGNRWASSINGVKLETIIHAFAAFLFRYTLEGWGGLRDGYRGKHALASSQTRFVEAFHLKNSRCLHPCEQGDLHCSEAERDWLFDHFVMEGLRGLFEEATSRAREMAKTGCYFLVDLSQWESRALPYTLGKFNAKSELEFWSVSFASDQELYRSDLQEMSLPISLPVIFRKERLSVEINA